jgi:hypothetical protein
METEKLLGELAAKKAVVEPEPELVTIK